MSLFGTRGVQDNAGDFRLELDKNSLEGIFDAQMHVQGQVDVHI